MNGSAKRASVHPAHALNPVTPGSAVRSLGQSVGSAGMLAARRQGMPGSPHRHGMYPSARDEDGWVIFCVSDDDAKGNSGSVVVVAIVSWLISFNKF